MIDRELIKRIIKQRNQHPEWICTRHDACTCDGVDCIYPCTCRMKKASYSIAIDPLHSGAQSFYTVDPLHNPAPNCACDFCKDNRM